MIANVKAAILAFISKHMLLVIACAAMAVFFFGLILVANSAELSTTGNCAVPRLVEAVQADSLRDDPKAKVYVLPQDFAQSLVLAHMNRYGATPPFAVKDVAGMVVVKSETVPYVYSAIVSPEGTVCFSGQFPIPAFEQLLVDVGKGLDGGA